MNISRLKPTMLIFVLFFLVSCDSIFGILTINKQIRLNGNSSTMTLSPGQYAAEVDVDSDHLDIILDSDKMDENKYFRFNIGRQQLPGENEVLVFDAATIGQPYDISIENTVENYDSDTVNTVESCTGTEIVEVCRFYNGRYHCVSEFRPFIGEKDVVYYERVREQSILASLLSKDGSVVGEFEAKDRSTDKVYELNGQCYK